jgi:hypothetical protein
VGVRGGGGRILIVLFLAFAPHIRAIDWPVPSAIMRTSFGQNNRGTPSLGAAFESSGYIGAGEAGDLLFTRNPSKRPSRLPAPLGAWVALDHGDGIISIYSRFDEEQTVAVPDKVERGRIIASAGRSGWSERDGFYFAFFDRKERRWVNPSRLIAPLPDAVAPVIYSVELRSADGREINPVQARSISQGRYTVFVNAADASLGGQNPPLAPYRILCSVNGLEAGALVFETYSVRDGALMVSRNGLAPVKQVYGAYPAYEIGEVWFTRGQAMLEIVVQDISGNSQAAAFRLAVE